MTRTLNAPLSLHPGRTDNRARRRPVGSGPCAPPPITSRTCAGDHRLCRVADDRAARRSGQQRGLPRTTERDARKSRVTASILRERSDGTLLHPGQKDQEGDDVSRFQRSWRPDRLVRQPPTDAGLASGFISFEFDPDYGRNGRFYTIHLEEVALPGALVPDNAGVPGLNVAGYAPTTPIPTPGAVDHEGVIVEWTDSNVSNATFEGTARELMRIPLNGRIHPLGDLSFNPLARRGDPDWRVLYVACGDGGSGDQKTAIRLNPQRLDTVVGKVLRIVPDLSEHKDRSVVSDNGRYRVPRDNPFVSVAGARPEIWAYGLRNPHRLGWDVDPARPSSPNLIATVIGFHTWETVDIIHRGANYGFPDREGTQMLQGDQMTDLPQPDTLPVHVTDSLTKGPSRRRIGALTATGQPGGDAIAGGFVYRGTAVPQLSGKFIFGDISTGRLWYSNFSDMRAADDGVARTVAEMRELRVWWDDPTDSPDRGRQLYPTLRPIVEAGYRSRGGKQLPGTATVAGSGRVDLRFGSDRSGELYLMSKSDGMIRIVTAAGAASGVSPAR